MWSTSFLPIKSTNLDQKYIITRRCTWCYLRNFKKRRSFQFASYLLFGDAQSSELIGWLVKLYQENWKVNTFPFSHINVWRIQLQRRNIWFFIFLSLATFRRLNDILSDAECYLLRDSSILCFSWQSSEITLSNFNIFWVSLLWNM